MHEDEGTIEVKEDDIVRSDRYPRRAEGILEAVDKVFSYMACKNCKSKKGDSACSKCECQRDSSVNFVCNVVLYEDDVLVKRKMFHEDITSVLGEKDGEREVQEGLFDLVGEKLTYMAMNETITNVIVLKV